MEEKDEWNCLRITMKNPLYIGYGSKFNIIDNSVKKV